MDSYAPRQRQQQGRGKAIDKPTRRPKKKTPLILYLFADLLSESRHRNDTSGNALQQEFPCVCGHGMGIKPAQLAARFRGYAAQCLVVAQHQHNAGDRLALINMAQAWAALAEQTEKNSPLLVGYDAPADIVGEDEDRIV